jgi:ribonuclease HII
LGTSRQRQEGPRVAALCRVESGLVEDLTAVERWMNGGRSSRAHPPLQARLRFERILWARGTLRVAGVDEAGRGPLAGPVVAAAVVLPPAGRLDALDAVEDSKRLRPAVREALYDKIVQTAVTHGVGIASDREIDSLNIHRAARLAMERAVAGCRPLPDFLLVDGLFTIQAGCPQCAVVRGDGHSLSVAAASILAKVTRDRIMVKLAEAYPHYGFEKHKGYGTRMHLDAIRRYGPSPVHRLTFSLGSGAG